MVRGIIALVFHCKITGGSPVTTEETADYRWATEDDVRDLAEEAYAVRVLDALHSDHVPAVRVHDGRRLV
jgi:8-oxo-dGTP diphosphatase